MHGWYEHLSKVAIMFAVIGFTIAGGKVVEMDILADPERLSRLGLSTLEG